MKRRTKQIVVGIAAINLLLLASVNCWASTPTWGRGISGIRVIPTNGPQFDVTFISEESGELVASCMLANIRSGSYQPAPLVIEGEWQQGVFWPSFVLQVGNEFRGPWYSVSMASSHATRGRLIVEPGKIVTDLRIKLGSFRNYIGNYRVGRIVLSSGDSGVFQLIHLRPPQG